LRGHGRSVQTRLVRLLSDSKRLRLRGQPKARSGATAGIPVTQALGAF
jgi:hypothetical protein